MKFQRANKKQVKRNAIIYILIALAFIISWLKTKEDILAIGSIIMILVSFYWSYKAWR